MTTHWIQRFGEQTRARHAAADAQRLVVMDAHSLVQYRKFLERVWGFERAVEVHASGVPGLENAARGARTRVGRLHDDLIALGATTVDIATLPQVAVEMRTASEALGWLLVIERHVLLAGLIRRFLAEHLGGFATASRYFDSHRDGGTRYRELGDHLGHCIATGHARPDAILAAARQAFDAQVHWYSRIQRLRARRDDTGDPTQPRSAA